MKLDARRVEAFLREPGAARAVLFHGEDPGLVAERARALVRLVAGTLDDPFRVVELDRASMGALGAELASLCIGGGRRVVRLREATDAVAAALKTALEGPGTGLAVLEAGALPSSSKLRTLLDKAADGAAIGCYPQEGRALLPVIRDTLAEARVSADEDALDWLAGQLGADRGVTRREIEKLALYAGPGGRVDIGAARRSVGDLAGLSADDAIYAAASGDVASADRGLELALAEGGSAVGIIRQALAHVQRLARTREAMRGGLSAADAVRMLRPPLFFRRQSAFLQALALWSEAELAWAARRLWDAERACKTTGYPPEPLCRNALVGIAQRAAQARTAR